MVQLLFDHHLPVAPTGRHARVQRDASPMRLQVHLRRAPAKVQKANPPLLAQTSALLVAKHQPDHAVGLHAIDLHPDCEGSKGTTEGLFQNTPGPYSPFL